MGTVTSVVNLKGGAGKTTLALSLVSAWKEKGQKAILIDADGGQRTAADILGIGTARGTDAIELVQLTDWKLLRKQARAFAKDYERVVIDTPRGDSVRSQALQSRLRISSSYPYALVLPGNFRWGLPSTSSTSGTRLRKCLLGRLSS